MIEKVKLQILKDDHPVLRQKAEPVEFSDPKFLVDLARDMIDIMVLNKGVGLAAPQIGASIRMIVFKGSRQEPWIMCNPEIVKYSGKSKAVEGCLSLPSKKVMVERSKNITLKYYTPLGTRMTAKFRGDEARVIQHEIDHLNGILITDYMK